MESRLNNLVPMQLLRLWIGHEKDLVRELVALGEMVPSSPWQQRLLQLLERHFRRIGDYTQVFRRHYPHSLPFECDVLFCNACRHWIQSNHRRHISGPARRKKKPLYSTIETKHYFMLSLFTSL